MAELNNWWMDSPSERYWLEITDRTDLGADLIAPQEDDAGRPYWSYNLVTAVRDGDVVLHWHKSLDGEPGIVGWSRAAGTPESAETVWQARGTGRSKAASGPEPAWRIALVDYTPLVERIDQEQLRVHEQDIRRLLTDLQATYPGSLYFPFAFSDKRPIRATQGYLTKFPRGLLDIFPQLNDIPHPEARPPRAPTPGSAAPSPRRGGASRIADPVLRRALEYHAVRRATDDYVELGYDVEDVGATESFDLLVHRGDERRHVEVKGSSVPVSAVELTAGEVVNAHGDYATDLFVVDGIQWQRERDGSVATAGGRVRVWFDWQSASDNLSPTRYRYTLPTDE